MYKLTQYVVGTMTIVHLNGKDVKTGKAPIYMNKLSGEQMLFITHVKLPSNMRIVLELVFDYDGKKVNFEAELQSCEQKGKNEIYVYIVKYLIRNEKDRDQILPFVNGVQIANKTKKLSRVTSTSIELNIMA
ncbi:hypothetical protein [Bacillus alkalisoli]|uniref:hypothetical protein n=1 Tax=Bacillus alkalisoli TaxID=2011008 RepID=UPI000C251164|nr:hypothetical protein [Bacillus alkalisoli]